MKPFNSPETICNPQSTQAALKHLLNPLETLETFSTSKHSWKPSAPWNSMKPSETHWKTFWNAHEISWNAFKCLGIALKPPIDTRKFLINLLAPPANSLKPLKTPLSPWNFFKRLKIPLESYLTPGNPPGAPWNALKSHRIYPWTPKNPRKLHKVYKITWNPLKLVKSFETPIKPSWDSRKFLQLPRTNFKATGMPWSPQDVFELHWSTMKPIWNISKGYFEVLWALKSLGISKALWIHVKNFEMPEKKNSSETSGNFFEAFGNLSR